VHADPLNTNARLGRRTLLRAGVLGSAGLAAAALIGCGDEGDDNTPASATAGASATATASGGLKVGDYPVILPESSKPPKNGGVLKVAHTWDVATFDPTKSAAGGTITVPNTVYNRLLGFARGVDRDPAKPFELKPELAESWERTPDGLTYSFKLRKGVKWQNVAPLNGREFKAADAKRTYERYASEGVHTAFWVNRSSIDAVDDSTLKITLKRSLADFINPLGSRYQTIFPPETVDDGTIDKKVVGTGPMILKEATQGQRVVFDSNPDYWEVKPHLDGFEFDVTPDAAARLGVFRTGNVDYAYGAVANVRDVQTLLSTNPQTVVQVQPVQAPTFTIRLNLKNPKFQDERVRQAMMLALDRDRIVQVLFQGYGLALPSILWTTLFDEEPKAGSPVLGKWWRYAPEEAKQLLDAAGAKNLTFGMPYYNYSVSQNEQQNALIADMFKAVGITMNFRVADYTEYNSQLIGAKYEDAIDGWPTPASGDADTYYYAQLYSKSPGNRDTIADPDIDMWAEQQQVELDPARRREIFRKIWDRVLDKAYRVDKAGTHTFFTYQPWFQGMQFGGAQSDFYDWGVQIAHAWLDK
jgi:ABC-type transport system substrate-binding protein